MTTSPVSFDVDEDGEKPSISFVTSPTVGGSQRKISSSLLQSPLHSKIGFFHGNEPFQSPMMISPFINFSNSQLKSPMNGVSLFSPRSSRQDSSLNATNQPANNLSNMLPLSSIDETHDNCSGPVTSTTQDTQPFFRSTDFDNTNSPQPEQRAFLQHILVSYHRRLTFTTISHAFHHWHKLSYTTKLSLYYKSKLLQAKTRFKILSKHFYNIFYHPTLTPTSSSTAITNHWQEQYHQILSKMKHYYIWKSQYYYMQYFHIHKQYQTFFRQYKLFSIFIKYAPHIIPTHLVADSDIQVKYSQSQLSLAWKTWKECFLEGKLKALQKKCAWTMLLNEEHMANKDLYQATIDQLQQEINYCQEHLEITAKQKDDLVQLQEQTWIATTEQQIHQQEAVWRLSHVVSSHALTLLTQSTQLEKAFHHWRSSTRWIAVTEQHNAIHTNMRDEYEVALLNSKQEALCLKAIHTLLFHSHSITLRSQNQDLCRAFSCWKALINHYKQTDNQRRQTIQLVYNHISSFVTLRQRKAIQQAFAQLHRVSIHHSYRHVQSLLAQQQEQFMHAKRQLMAVVATRQQEYIGALQLQQFQLDRLTSSQLNMEHQQIQFQQRWIALQLENERLQMIGEDKLSYYCRALRVYADRFTTQDEHMEYQTSILQGVKITLQTQTQQIDHQKHLIDQYIISKKQQQTELTQWKHVSVLQQLWMFLSKHYYQQLQSMFTYWKYVSLLVIPLQKQQQAVYTQYQKNVHHLSILKQSYQKEIVQYQQQLKEIHHYIRKHHKMSTFLHTLAEWEGKHRMKIFVVTLHHAWQSWKEYMILQAAAEKKNRMIDQGVDCKGLLVVESIGIQTEKKIYSEQGINTSVITTVSISCGKDISYHEEDRIRRRMQQLQDEKREERQQKQMQQRMACFQLGTQFIAIFKSHTKHSLFQQLYRIFTTWKHRTQLESVSLKLKQDVEEAKAAELQAANAVRESKVRERLQLAVTAQQQQSKQSVEKLVHRKLDRMVSMIDIWRGRLLVQYMFLCWYDAVLIDDNEEYEEEDEDDEDDTDM